MATDAQRTFVTEPRSIVMMGATGAVGGEAMRALQTMPSLARLTLLTRRLLPEPLGKATTQHAIDVFSSASYAQWMAGHDAAICTLGVGQPSKTSEAEFIRIDKDAVIEFAGACRRAGVKHFELLASVGISSTSRSLYLRTKGELRDALIAMNFDRLSVFQPSMILTPTNRYGVSQALALALWPKLSPLLRGGWQKYRGIEVATLGKAIAANVFTEGRGVESLHWPEIMAIADASALR
jgi:uncharacterized protein YbjT (DUF2867 family)